MGAKGGLFLSNEVSGQELEYMLGSVSVDALVNEYFGKKALLVKGAPDKFQKLFDRAALERALARGSHELGGEEPPLLRASFARGSRPNQRVGETRLFRISADQVRPLYDAGASICADWVSNAAPRLRALALAVKTQLNYPGAVRFNAYMSPDGHGFDTHFDARIATTLQLEGSKVWRYTKTPVVDWPLENAFGQADGSVRYGDARYSIDRTTRGESAWETPREPAAEEWDEVLLEPGDVLMLPAGALHSARAEGHSLALNMAFEPFSFVSLMEDVLRAAFVDRAEWRAAPPCFALDSDRPAAEAFMSARLDELRALLAKLTPDSIDLLRPWGRSVVETGARGRGAVLTPPSPARPSAVAPVARRSVERTDVLALAHLGTTRMRGRGGRGPALILYAGETETEVDGPLIPLVEQMVAARKFRAETATEWAPLEWPRVAAALEMFLEAKILCRADG